jgi:hypothetical protein
VATSNTSSDAESVTFEASGVRLRVTADTPEVIERFPAVLPPGAKPSPSATVDESFGVLAGDDHSYRFERSGAPVADRLDLALALMLLGNQLRLYVGTHARNGIFVHAGVVAYERRTIVMPGLSLAGKTTLVLELVRAGAVYYSDEFALLDEHGLVHPYPTTPALREPLQPNDADVELLDRGRGTEPLPIGAVVFTTYRPGAQWNPTRLPPGRGVMAMLAHAPAAVTRSEEAMRVISRAIDGAVILEGDRGEARELVPQLLSAVSAKSSGG